MFAGLASYIGLSHYSDTFAILIYHNHAAELIYFHRVEALINT